MKRNPWPYAIILYFVFFITFLAVWITFAVRNDHELVRKDYYEQEMNFQNEIDSSARAAALNIAISYEASKEAVTITGPSMTTSGTIYFYRASQAKMDREIPLLLKDGAQTIDVRGFERGLWKVRLSWTVNGLPYRRDESLIFGAAQLSSL
jgi:hypothetical protein